MAKMSVKIDLDPETLAETEAAFAAQGTSLEQGVLAFLADVRLDAALDRIGAPPRVTCPPDRDFDEWVAEKVQQALNDPRPAIPHEDAMRQLDRMLEERERARTGLV
jgi:DNA-damage-inducible protein J